MPISISGTDRRQMWRPFRKALTLTVCEPNNKDANNNYCNVYKNYTLLVAAVSSGGNSDAAHQRMEEIILLGITCLAGLTYLPLASREPRHNLGLKAGVAETLGRVLCDTSLASLTSEYLALLGHPRTCATVIKVCPTTLTLTLLCL